MSSIDTGADRRGGEPENLFGSAHLTPQREEWLRQSAMQNTRLHL
jgi:hypothetical protein